MAKGSWPYKTLAVSEDTHFKVKVWADERGSTLAEAVDYAFDNLGPPDDVFREGGESMSEGTTYSQQPGQGDPQPAEPPAEEPGPAAGEEGEPHPEEQPPAQPPEGPSN